GANANASLDEAFYGIYASLPRGWYKTQPSYPPKRLRTLIRAYVQPKGNNRAAYFKSQRDFFHDELNDKLLRGLDLFVNLIGPATVVQQKQALTAAGIQPWSIRETVSESPVLGAFYQDLKDHTINGVLDFLVAVPAGILKEFFSQVVI